MEITQAQLAGMVEVVSRNPIQLLQIEGCRRALAVSRWEKHSRIEVHQAPNDGVISGTVSHNRRETEQGIFGSQKRTRRLINALSSIDPVYGEAPRLKVLDIGPRTEMEIFNLIAAGFDLSNITAIDLISSSPLIQMGDMHKLELPDASMDVVISSWVIGYSSVPQIAIDEMVRVCKPGGLIAIGATYEAYLPVGIVPPGAEGATDITGCNFSKAEHFAQMIGGRLGAIQFQHDPDDGKRGAVMLIGRLTDG